ncbi:nuclear inhibitor of protein phosphatase 1 [Nilaparvata lugens]|uniref:nuclear inhibitor of protein phosphatase 1 n=1 Tax=Nilaparvata lugens TaxID=108931 RepID=UPI000B999F1C|nr:nuclear inhibitor of protein phosphatase 1 [Nilaparvata lugens]
MANHYDVPKWAGKPPVGFHLDVMKGDKLIQKLMLDEKKCYLFGRNPQMCDFCVDHQSCSRVHAALVYHKVLNRTFLVDLGSTHGTFISTLRIEPHKPTQLPLDSVFSFGASTRSYIIRERPQTAARPIIEEIEKNSKDTSEGILLGLPETETELDNLTEFNTAHNRRISMLGIDDNNETNKIGRQSGKRKNRYVTINEEEEIINPEDTDPSIGRFRNLVHTTVVPTKRVKMESVSSEVKQIKSPLGKSLAHSSANSLYSDLPGSDMHPTNGSLLFSSKLASSLGLVLPNPAPDIEMTPTSVAPSQDMIVDSNVSSEKEIGTSEPKKKKYAKEAWPRKKPVPALLV